jgi:RimJ/RimL family protein N-acetyltransferase
MSSSIPLKLGVVSTQHIENNPAKPIEIGWRLRSEHWGKGYATEAGQAMLRFAFDQVGVPEVLISTQS